MKNKKIIFILSGTLIAIFIIIGINVLAFNKKIQTYEVDENYISQNQIKNDDEQLGNKNKDIDNREVESSKDNDSVEEITKDKETSDTNKTNEQDGSDISKEDIKDDKADVIDSTKNDNEDVKKENNDITQSSDEDNADKSDKPEEDYKSYTNHDWVDDKINENREEIADEDLDTGLLIGDKIDDDIVLGYLEDGLTNEEKADLKEYLKIVLSDAEYQEMNVLFDRYNYMMDE
ncbi:hypothetical protein SH1V18_42510 [Vallitalea longa]|uniref:Uncharacterized protein n=1 Tax=Vallitalea longa TaxID=2936439 RepID=A0A9W6DFZ6_9FIRM|nr:hypothetical protein [Vallitalea longa]GKX31771.1 hypothetical protein SH1V18_42510 [Vallitalea longa]